MTNSSDASETIDPNKTYQEALDDWQSICHAFGTFARSLGSDFQPLDAVYAETREETFGPALQYRTHSIASFSYLNRWFSNLNVSLSHASLYV